jgi:transcriptional regulator with XRE-family HTH domain
MGGGNRDMSQKRVVGKKTVQRMERIGRKVRLILELRDMTQQDLAEAVGYASNAMVNHLVNGRRLPSLNKIEEIAVALGISPGYLMDDHDYSKADLQLIIKMHDTIINKKERPLYNALIAMFDIK